LHNRLVSHYWCGDAIRSRSVSDTVLSGKVDVPAPPARLLADWNREISLHLGLEPGDVEALPLARARMRWPEYRHCVQAVSGWARTMGLQNVLETSEAALMACRGARYHHDGAQYGGSAFCNLFLSEDVGLDLHFASTGHRISLKRGTVVMFDTGQPHAVIDRRGSGFSVADFPPDRDCTQIFLTWELPVEHAEVKRALQINFDIEPARAIQPDHDQLWLNGTEASVCPESGCWHPATSD
jgi:hypothetical protein